MAAPWAEPEIEVRVEAGAHQGEAEPRGLALAQFATALVQHLCGDEPAGLSVLLCDDAAIRVLNREHRGFDKATDVLSFPAGVDGFLGDVAISWDTASARIGPGTWSIDDELAFLLLHGVLHLLGHDHEQVDEREEMERREVELWAALGREGPVR